MYKRDTEFTILLNFIGFICNWDTIALIVSYWPLNWVAHILLFVYSPEDKDQKTLRSLYKNRLRSPHPRPSSNRLIPRTFRSNFPCLRMLWPCKQFILEHTVYRHCVCTEQQMHDYFMYINHQTDVILLQNVKFSLLYLISFQTTWI